MKTATLPALRVDPELREAEGDFIARGLRSARKAREHDRYITAAAVVGKLEKKLTAARKDAKSR